tara:strand:+ start:9522 stop:10283 length:762 start_codon:yes stop_codon:yes gene_type:complete
MKPLNVLNFMKKKEEKKSVKEGMIFLSGLYPGDKEINKNAKKMCGFGTAGKVRNADNYEKNENGEWVVREGRGGKGVAFAREIFGEESAWEGTIEGETHIECRKRAKRELKDAHGGPFPSYITKYYDMLVSYGGGMLGFLILAAIVGTILALKNSSKKTLLFEDLIKKKQEEKEKCDARSKEGKCVDEIVGTTPSRTHLRMRLEDKEKEDYEIRKSEADQQGLKDAVKMISKGGGKAYRNKRSKKKGGSKKRK